MTLEVLARRVEHFNALGFSDQIRLFGWFLHAQRDMARFETADIRACFDELHLRRPANISQLITQLTGKDLLRDRHGLRLSRPVREAYDALYCERVETLEVDRLLVNLVAVLSDPDQQDYLEEALRCFRSGAFRAATVMTWNLTYDHLVATVANKHLASFNDQLGKMYNGTRKQPLNRADFQKLKESDVLEVCNAAGLLSKETSRVMGDALGRRNTAAHASGSKIDKLQTEAYISNVIRNGMLQVR